MTANPPTTRYLAPTASKHSNRSLKSEFIFATVLSQIVLNKLPCGAHPRGCILRLPERDIEFAVHILQATAQSAHSEGVAGLRFDCPFGFWVAHQIQRFDAAIRVS